MSRQLDIMSESNERLARVETKLEYHGSLLDRMERHMESISLAHQESAKAVAQIPGLMEKLISQGDRLDYHAARITRVEATADGAIEGVKSLNKLRPVITRMQMITRTTVWLAGIAVGGCITVAIKGIFL